MNIIKLHKSITLNVFAFLGFIIYIIPTFWEISMNIHIQNEYFFGTLILLCVSLLAEYIAKRCKYHKAFNLCFNFKVKWTKILYLIAFSVGLSIPFSPFDKIALGFIILSTIPINYLRRSIITNTFACLGFIWTVFCCWHYYDLYTPPIQAGLGNVVAFELFVCFIPISLIATVIFIACMFFEKKWHSKSEDYGKWFLHIPEVFHLLYLYIGLIGLMACALLIYTFAFLGIEIYIFEAITKILDIYL